MGSASPSTDLGPWDGLLAQLTRHDGEWKLWVVFENRSALVAPSDAVVIVLTECLAKAFPGLGIEEWRNRSTFPSARGE